MTVFIALVFIVLIGFVLFALNKHNLFSNDRDDSWPYQARKLLTGPEQIFYHRLVSALPECVVFTQVELSRLIEVKSEISKDWPWFNKINGKSLDFVVCLKDLSVVAVIELDDKTHVRAKRVKADTVKDKALAAAGVEIIRWKVSSMPDESVIRQKFTQ